MKPETKETLNRIRKNRVVRVVAVGVMGAVIYTKMMNHRGYQMVIPYRFDEGGEVFAKTVFGKIYKITFENA